MDDNDIEKKLEAQIAGLEQDAIALAEELEEMAQDAAWEIESALSDLQSNVAHRITEWKKEHGLR